MANMEHVKPQTRQTIMGESNKHPAQANLFNSLCTPFIEIKNNSKRLISVPGGLLNDSIIKESKKKGCSFCVKEVFKEEFTGAIWQQVSVHKVSG